MKFEVQKLSKNATWQDVKAPCLLFVYTEWCGYSRRAWPLMNRVSQTLGTTVPVVGIDADEHAQLSKALGVKSYPTVIFYNVDGLHPFTEERSVDAIVAHVCKYSSGTSLSFCS